MKLQPVDVSSGWIVISASGRRAVDRVADRDAERRAGILRAIGPTLSPYP